MALVALPVEVGEGFRVEGLGYLADGSGTAGGSGRQVHEPRPPAAQILLLA
jgi:hypothetical protein